MNRKNIHNLLVDSRPTDVKGNKNFVERTMQAVRAKRAAAAFNEATLASAAPKKQSLFTLFTHLPKFAAAALVIGGVLVISGTAYAAIRLLEPKVNITDYNASNEYQKNQYAVHVSDCGVLGGGVSIENGDQLYEVSPEANLSKEQVVEALQDECKYLQILEMLGKRWASDPKPTIDQKVGDTFDYIQEGEGAHNSLNDPSIGTVTAKSDTHITITSTIYESFEGPTFIKPSTDGSVPDVSQYYHYHPGGKVLNRTFLLSAEAEVLVDNQTATLADVKIGDNVFFMTKNRYTIVGDGQDATWNKHDGSQVIRLIKTDIKLDNLQHPNIAGAIAKLERCQGNSDYLCIASTTMSLHFDMVYATSKFQDSLFDQNIKENDKYFRADISDDQLGSAYHAIEGRITKLDGNKLTLQSRGKMQTFTLTLPYDAIKAYNSKHEQQVVQGDVVQIRYAQKSGEDRTEIKSSDIMALSLAQRRTADGTLVKY